MSKTTKADLQAQVAQLAASIKNIPDHRVLKVCMDHMIHTDMSRQGHGWPF
jgi:hypothetical protein